MALAADCDPDATTTYAANLNPSVVWRADLSSISPFALLDRANLSMGSVDLIVGGPPCQGFSSAGARDWNDPRNTLLRHFVSIITTLRPTWFIMENVEGLLTARGGFYIIEAVSRFLDAGYWVGVKKVYMERYGLPQRRKRVLVVGNLEECAFQFPLPSHDENPAQLWETPRRYRTILDGIGDLPIASTQAAGYCVAASLDYQQQLRRYDGLPIAHHYPRSMNDLLLQRITALAPGQTMKALPAHLQHPSFQRRAYRRVMDGTPTERRGGAPSGLKRLVPNQPSLTITSASPTEFVHPHADRFLTLRECARLQSFPDWFEFTGSWSSVATQIGNAIPPYFMEQLARSISEQAHWQRSRRIQGRWLGIDASKSTGMSPALSHMLAQLEERTLSYA